MKDKKKLLLIGGIVLVVVLGIALFLILSNTDKTSPLPVDKPEEKVEAPATSTEELKQEMEVIETATITEDKIEFSSAIELTVNQKVAVWIYSEPKFLGYFDVIEENGVKVIKGLKEAMDKIDIEPGEHNIAITTEEGESVGYVNVYVEENKIFEDEQTAIESKYTTKEVVEKTEIKYQTETKRDANKKSGSREVTQKGVNGEKEVTYKVTYDETGKEISREKISEKVTKNAIKEIVVVGAADYNINTAKIMQEAVGFMCREDQTVTNGGYTGCDDMQELPSFKAIQIDGGTLRVVTINGSVVTPITLTRSGDVYSGTYKGAKHYFDPRGGGGNPDGEPLTMELCKEYNLSCGAW